MEFVLELLLAQLQLALQHGNELVRVFAQHFAHGQLDRAVVLDDDDAAGNRHLASREGIQRVHELLRVHACRALDLDLDVLRREIVDGFHLELALAHGVFEDAISDSVVVPGGSP